MFFEISDELKRFAVAANFGNLGKRIIGCRQQVFRPEQARLLYIFVWGNAEEVGIEPAETGAA